MSSKKLLKKYWHVPFLCVAVVIALWLRVINPWDSVFVWVVRFSGNDPWYYYRLIDTTLVNFPNRIWFDAFTQYPYGTYTHFGPFLVYLGAILVKISGANDPEGIKSVLAFIPAIAGTLLVFPTYLFTKEVFNKKAGVIAALLIVVIPGQLLHRSVLGFNDHHVWEVFWMVSTLGLFSASVNRLKDVENIMDILQNRTGIIFSILSGTSLGLFLLSWAAGFIVAAIIVLYVFLATALKHYVNVNTLGITFSAIVTILIGGLLYLPYSNITTKGGLMMYKPINLYLLILLALITGLFYVIDLIDRKGYFSKSGLKEQYTFPFVISTITAILLGVPLLTNELLFNTVRGIIGVTRPKGGALTIAEVQPFFTSLGEFSLAPAWGNFSMTFFFAIPGIILLTAMFLLKGEDRKDLHIIALVWGILMFIALAGQNRFAYYFGAVSAVFAAVMLDSLLSYLKFYNGVQDAVEKGSDGLKKTGTFKIAVSILLIFMLFYPTITDSKTQSEFAGGGMNSFWYDALDWIHDNTPDKEFYDEYYYELYPPINEGLYPYPQETYSVISWWDYGHWITVIAHRIPVANPFQQGIGSKEGSPGAAPFFTAFNESEANAIADELGVRYVVSDVEMATGKFYAMATWAEGTIEEAGSIYYAGQGYVYSTPDGRIGIAPSQFQIPQNSQLITVMNVPSENYYNTMEAKLHIFDGFGLKNYRMLYESGASNTIEILYRLVYNNFYSQTLGYPPINATPTGYVKVFEYVPGAKITGKISSDAGTEPVILNLIVQTNQGRVYTYAQVTEPVDGTYSFTVPYAQETKYPVKPVSPYYISIGNMTKTISITDDDVLNGNTLTLDLI